MSWRLALRLARREVARRPGRAALVTLLVAVPVCGMTLAVVLFRTDQLSTGEQFRLFHAGANASLPLDPAEADAPTQDLPDGTPTVDVRETNVDIQGPGSDREYAWATDLPLGGDFGGPYRLVAGREPTAPGEVAVSRSASDAAEVTIGDEVTISADSQHIPPDVDQPQRATVVGLVEDSSCLSCSVVVVHPDSELLALEGREAHRYALLPEDLPTQELRRLAAGGWLIAPDLKERIPGEGPAFGHSDDSPVKVRWALVVGAVALTAAGVVISAAFAVSARRQLTTLGQLSATGASPALLRRTLALQGTVSGVLGLVAGWGLAALILTLGRGRTEVLLDHRLPTWDLRLPDLGAVAVAGLVAATLSALVPARTAATIPTLAALAGRRPLTPVPRGLTVRGLAAIVAGLGLTALAIMGGRTTHMNPGDSQVWVLVAIVGGVLQLLGACAVTPAMTSKLEPLASRLRGPWRLGARSLARNRTRTGAVVAAVAAAGALTVFGGGLVRGFQADDDRDWYQLPEDMVVASAMGDRSTSQPDHDAQDQRDQAQGATSGELSSTHAPEEPAEQGADTATTTTIAVPTDHLPMVETPPDEATLTAIESIVAEGTGTSESSGDDSDSAMELATIRGTVQTSVSHEWTVTARGDHLASSPHAVVADEAVLDMFDAPDALRDRLESDGMALVRSLEPEDGAGVEDLAVILPDGRRRAVAYAPDLAGTFPDRFGALIISPELAESLDLTIEDTAIAMQAPEPLSAEQWDELEELRREEAGGEANRLELWFDQPSDEIAPVSVEVLLSAVALVVALLVTGTSLALSAAESRDEREVLTVVGTRPRDLARSAGAKAGLLALLGGALAALLGLAQVTVVSWTWTDGLPFRPPWLTLALVLVVVPLLATLAASTTSALAQRARPVRISTATFE